MWVNFPCDLVQERNRTMENKCEVRITTFFCLLGLLGDSEVGGFVSVLNNNRDGCDIVINPKDLY